MKKNLEKNKKRLLIFFLVIIILIGIGMFVILESNLNNKIHNINEEKYSLEYDNTWKVVSKNENDIELIHKKSKSELNIKINELKDEYQYKTLTEISDYLLYNIQEQNKEYKLIYKENSKITKNSIDAYKVLFETEDSQVAMYYFKQENNIIVITYETTFDYFDILLDSVNSIIYSLNIKEQKYDVKAKINLNTTPITYTSQKEISNLLKDTTNNEIASSNYLVNYSIPDIFKLTTYDTQYGYYILEDSSTESNIELKTSILKCNLYEYLDKEKSPNVYENYNTNLYNKNNEELDIFIKEPLSYIYKNSYSSDTIKENIEIVFELNKDHIFIVKLSSDGVGIPEELVKMIKINKVENIASNVSNEKEDEFLIGKLKKFLDYTNEKTEEISLKIPTNYVEVDKDNNLYEKRNYICNYDDEKGIPEYEVSYEITNFNVNEKLELIEEQDDYLKEYGEYKKFINLGNIIINSKEFNIYNRQYTRSK